MTEKMSALVTTAYFPPVLYFKEIYNSDSLIIEVNDNYTKQTYRNRTKILSANGVLALSFPIIKTHNQKVKTKDVRIDYSIRWQKNHYRALLSAYKSSPFFEYYIDYFIPFFEKRYNFLIDFNTDILKQLFNVFDIKKDIKFTDDYFANVPLVKDLREKYYPKKQNTDIENCKKYKQVFDAKFNFVPNLSILDMLFNLGPETDIYFNNNAVN